MDDWAVVYGPVTPTAVTKRPARDPYCGECGLSLGGRFGGHHPGCPEGDI